MRIIRGKYKGRHVPTPTGFKARPTTDFAKEGLFNILENVYIDFGSEPTALDLFAGTGSISLELASRGCRKVVSVEKDFKHWQFLSRVQKDLQVKEWVPLKGDVFKYAKTCKEKYDIIFADPPYALEQLKDIPDSVLPLLADDGLMILEHGGNYDFTNHPCYADHRNYGSVNFTFFIKPSETEAVKGDVKLLEKDAAEDEAKSFEAEAAKGGDNEINKENQY